MSRCFPHSVSHCCPERLTPCPHVMRAVAYGVWRLVGEKSSVKSPRHNCQPMDPLITLDSTRESGFHSAEVRDTSGSVPVLCAGIGIRKCFMSQTRLTGARCRRWMSPVFKVWWKWKFDRRDGKPFYVSGRKCICWADSGREGCWATMCKEGDTEK